MIDVSAINDWLSPLLYGLAPLVFLVPAFRKRAWGMWLYAAWLFFAWWCFTHRLDRFWVPMLPVIALLAGAGAVWSSERVWKIVLGSVIAAAVLFNLVLIATQNAGYIAWLTELEAAQQFTARLTAPEIAEINRLMKTLPGEIRVLSVGDAEVFDARFPIVYNTVFDRSIFQEWTAKPNPGLAGCGTSHAIPQGNPREIPPGRHHARAGELARDFALPAHLRLRGICATRAVSPAGGKRRAGTADGSQPPKLGQTHARRAAGTRAIRLATAIALAEFLQRTNPALRPVPRSLTT